MATPHKRKLKIVVRTGTVFLRPGQLSSGISVPGPSREVKVKARKNSREYNSLEN